MNKSGASSFDKSGPTGVVFKVADRSKQVASELLQRRDAGVVPDRKG